MLKMLVEYHILYMQHSYITDERSIFYVSISVSFSGLSRPAEETLLLAVLYSELASADCLGDLRSADIVNYYLNGGICKTGN